MWDNTFGWGVEGCEMPGSATRTGCGDGPLQEGEGGAPSGGRGLWNRGVRERGFEQRHTREGDPAQKKPSGGHRGAGAGRTRFVPLTDWAPSNKQRNKAAHAAHGNTMSAGAAGLRLHSSREKGARDNSSDSEGDGDDTPRPFCDRAEWLAECREEGRRWLEERLGRAEEAELDKLLDAGLGMLVLDIQTLGGEMKGLFDSEARVERKIAGVREEMALALKEFLDIELADFRKQCGEQINQLQSVVARGGNSAKDERAAAGDRDSSPEKSGARSSGAVPRMVAPAGLPTSPADPLASCDGTLGGDVQLRIVH